jgi:hypothetical protein
MTGPDDLDVFGMAHLTFDVEAAPHS